MNQIGAIDLKLVRNIRDSLFENSTIAIKFSRRLGTSQIIIKFIQALSLIDVRSARNHLLKKET